MYLVRNHNKLFFVSFNKAVMLRSATRFALATALALSAGCVSMKGIEPQAEPMPAAQFGAGKAIAAAPQIAWPAENWWAAYHDPQLNALVARSIEASPTLRIAQARVRLAQAFADSAHAGTLPNISGDAAFVRERFTELQFIPPPWAGHVDWDNKATVSLGYDLDLWGRQQNLWQASVDETRAVAAEVQQVKLELTSAIVRSYVRLALAFELRDLAAEHLEQTSQRIAIARRALAAGIGTELEVNEAETQLPLARAQIDAIDVRIGLLRNQLAALSGQGPGAGDAIARPTLTLQAGFGLPDRLPANLVGRRPDVLAQRWRVEAAQQGIAGAKAEFYPNINLLAFIGFQALGFGQFFSSAASIAGVGPAVSLPIFDGGRRRGNLSARTAVYDIAVESYNASLVQALEDVSDQLVVLQSNVKQRQEAEQALATARKAHALATASYRAGLNNYQHVLDTHASVLRQQENVAQLQAVRLDAYAGLMRALGGGTVDEAASVAPMRQAQQP